LNYLVLGEIAFASNYSTTTTSAARATTVATSAHHDKLRLYGIHTHRNNLTTTSESTVST
jgi:hypothetical protein